MNRRAAIIDTAMKAAALFAAAASLILLGIYYHSNGTGAGAFEVLKFAVFVAVFILPCGFFFAKTAGRGFPEDAGPLEKLALCLTAGYAVSCILCYLFSCAHAGWAYACLSAALFAAFVISGLKPRGRAGWNLKRNLLRLAREFDAPLALLAILIISRFLYAYCYVTLEPNGGVMYRQFLPDNRFFASIVHEISRGVPLRELPQLSGVPFPRYHFAGMFFAWMPVKYAGVDLMRSFHIYSPAFMVALLLTHVYYACRRATGSALLGYAGLVLLFLLCAPVTDLAFLKFRNPASSQMQYTYFSFTSLSALPLAAAFLHAFALRERAGARVMCALFAASVFLFKINFFLVLFPAFFAVEAVDALFRRGQGKQAARAMLWGLAFCALCAAVMLWYPGGAAVKIRYGYYGNYLVQQITNPTEGLLNFLSRLSPRALGVGFPLAASLFAPFAQMGFVHTLLAATFVFSAPKSRSAADFKLLALFVFICVEAIYLFVIEPVFAINVAVFLPTFIFVFATVPCVLGLAAAADFFKRRFGARASGPAKYALILLCLFSIACSARATFRPNSTYFTPLDRDELAVSEFLLKNTPPDSVVLTSREAPGLIPMFGGRRTVLCNPSIMSRYRDAYSARLADVNEFFRTQDLAAAGKILARYKVDYVVSFKDRRIHFPAEGLLKKVCGRGDGMVYRVEAHR